MIVVERKSTIRDKFRKYKVMVDGEKVGKIAGGEKKSFDILPGQHTILTKLDGMKSNQLEFTLSEGQELVFESYVDVSPVKIAGLYKGSNLRTYMRIRQVSK